MKKILLSIDDLAYSYPGTDVTTLKPFTQHISEGEVVGLIGKNGVGKSTLMKLVASILQPSRGAIKFNGHDSSHYKKRVDYLSEMIYISHDKVLLADMSVKEYFDLFSILYRNFSSELANQLLDEYGYKGQEKISSLSTGNRMKMYFIFALAARVKLILADEITAVMDPENREIFFEVLEKYSGGGVSFIIATNIVEDLEAKVHRVWVLDKGALFETEANGLKKHFTRKAA